MNKKQKESHRAKVRLTNTLVENIKEVTESIKKKPSIAETNTELLKSILCELKGLNKNIERLFINFQYGKSTDQKN